MVVFLYFRPEDLELEKLFVATAEQGDG